MKMRFTEFISKYFLIYKIFKMSKVIFDLHDQSGSIVPIVSDKRSISGWNEYQSKSASRNQILEWVESENYEGFGLMMGYGGFHVIDVDTKNAPQDKRKLLFNCIWSGIPPSLKEKLIVQHTRNGGEHIVYKCTEPALPSTLIHNPVTGKKVVETIGSNNYILIEPSPGYSVVSGSLSSVGIITPKEHDWLMEHCLEVGKSLLGDHVLNKSCISDYGIGSKRNHNFISESAAYLDSSGIDITKEYDAWIRIGYSIANEMGEEGREYYQKISSNYKDYDSYEVNQVYDHILKGHVTAKSATGATLRHIMREHKIKPPADDENKTAHKTKTAINFIKDKGLKRNLFTNKVEKGSGQLIADSDVDDIYLELRSSGLAVSKSDVASIINSSHVLGVNPVRDWFVKAEEYADEAVLTEFLDCLKFKDTNPENVKFLKAMFIKWLMQFPAVVLDGNIPRLVLVLIGVTHVGKSEFMRRMLPRELQKYFAESALDRDKDSEILMSEFLLINIDELAGIMKSSKNVERFKSLSSAQYFTLRTPYGKINERFNRKAILCGTSNRADVIQDHDTDNSRIIPLELESIEWERCNGIDRRALFGTLMRRYKDLGKDDLRLSPDELDMLKRQSGDFTVLNIEQELIQRFIASAEKAPENFKSVTEICDMLSQHSQQKFDAGKISRELNKLSYTRDRRRVKGSSSALSGYYVRYTCESVDDLKQRFFETGG